MKWLILITCVVLAQQPLKAPESNGAAKGKSTQGRTQADRTNDDNKSTKNAAKPIVAPIEQLKAATYNLSENNAGNDYAKQQTDIQLKLTLFTGLLVGVGLLQAWIVYRQIKLFRNSERAWLIVTTGKAGTISEHGNGWIAQGFGFTWKIKNVGKTPAFITKMGARFHPISKWSDLPSNPNVDVPDLLLETTNFVHGLSVGPGEVVERFAFAAREDRQPITTEQYKLINEGKIIWVGYGVVEYRLIFWRIKRRRTHFCYVWTPGSRESFVPSDKPRGYTMQT